MGEKYFGIGPRLGDALPGKILCGPLDELEDGPGFFHPSQNTSLMKIGTVGTR
jgi:hypothetical protein